MKKRLAAILLTLCLALSLAACSSGGSSAQPSQTQAPTQTQEPAAAEEPSVEKDTGEMSDAQKALAEAEAALEESLARNAASEAGEAGEVNEYGLTDQALQELVDAIRENVTNDYLNVYNISPSDFAWPEVQTEFWFETRFVMEQLSNFEFTSEPPETINNLSEEDNALATAMLTGIYEWVKAGGDFGALYDNALSEGNGVSAERAAQFLSDNVTFE